MIKINLFIILMRFAHRGITNIYPENTYSAIYCAFASDYYDGVEIDIQLTKDKKWVIYHDKSLYRLLKIKKNISEIKYQDIGLINNHKVNLLNDLVNMKGFNKFLNIEIKKKIDSLDKIVLNNLLAIIHKLPFKILISSFHWNWYEWCINNDLEFIFLVDNIFPIKGEKWLVSSYVYKNISSSIMSKKIVGTWGNPTDALISIEDSKETVVYVDGTFDLIHSGHIDFLKKAKSYGSYLIVGLMADDCVETYKRMPFLTLKDRTIMMENLKIVDKVISPAPFYNSKYGNLNSNFLDEHKIDKVVYAGEIGSWNIHYQEAIDREIMINFPYGKDNLSTTKIINNIKKRFLV